MGKLYDAGRERALAEFGLEKTAFAGQGAIFGGGAGALLGGLTGAIGADPGHRMHGAARGALAGGALGAAGGGVSGGLAAKYTGAMQAGMNNTAGMLRRGSNIALGAGALGAAGGGYAAGSTAQQSPWEKLQQRFQGMF